MTYRNLYSAFQILETARKQIDVELKEKTFRTEHIAIVHDSFELDIGEAILSAAMVYLHSIYFTEKAKKEAGKYVGQLLH